MIRVLAIATLLAGASARAHALDLVGVTLAVDGGAAREELVIALPSLALLVPLGPGRGALVTQGQLDALVPAIGAATFGQAPLAADGAPCPLAATAARLDGNAVRVSAAGPCARDPSRLTQTFRFLDALPAGHQVVFKTALGGEAMERVADARAEVVTLERGHPPGFGDFVVLGVEHIFTGYDHLLFLLGLLLAAGPLRRLFLTLTCFTLAHSVTLALAALSVVHLPTRLTESAIAASIVYVAIEDLAVKSPRRRWLVAFAFGLVHGFGFASALGDLHLGRGSLVPALFGFNAGVELGQVAIVVVAAPVLAAFRRSARFERFGVPALAGVAIAFGAFWFVQRAFL